MTDPTTNTVAVGLDVHATSTRPPPDVEVPAAPGAGDVV